MPLPPSHTVSLGPKPNANTCQSGPPGTGSNLPSPAFHINTPLRVATHSAPSGPSSSCCSALLFSRPRPSPATIRSRIRPSRARNWIASSAPSHTDPSGSSASCWMMPSGAGSVASSWVQRRTSPVAGTKRVSAPRQPIHTLRSRISRTL